MSVASTRSALHAPQVVLTDILHFGQVYRAIPEGYPNAPTSGTAGRALQLLADAGSGTPWFKISRSVTSVDPILIIGRLISDSSFTTVPR